MATSLESLETKLNEVLVTKAPVQLPESWRKWLATYSWVFALIGFIFGVATVLLLLPLLGIASVFGAAVGAGGYVLFAWLSLIVFAGYVVLLGVAIPKLKRMEKAGWNLIFYSTLFFFVYDILKVLTNFGAGSVFGLVWSAFVTVVSLYFTFQIRSKFVSKKN